MTFSRRGLHELGVGSMSRALEKARQVKLLVLDVDGVLSDGRLLYSNSGDEIKAFYTADGLGIKLLQSEGVKVAIITGRNSEIVSRRARELGIEYLVQGRDDKLEALRELLLQLDLKLSATAYMGDDLPDLGAIQACALGMTVANGSEYVASHADWCSQHSGGRGAVREACEFILQAQDKLDEAQSRFLAGSKSA
jgi:3-deoxy-D-manno-octulosonate 8-phosphate phosphatase (KDO 8-P phosphatase)